MKAQAKSLGLLCASVLCLAASSTARADRAPAPPPPAETTPHSDQLGLDALHQAACLGKLPRQLCDLDKGGAGTCLLVKGPTGSGVLQCVPAPNAEAFEQGPMLMMMFGILVAIVGFFFWFRLKKNWGKT